MEVILQTTVPNLGKLGQKVKVKNGYAMNYLIPQGMAVQATAANLEKFEQRRAELEKKAADVLKAAQERAEHLKDLVVVIEAQASEEGKLYGSIGTTDLSRTISEQGKTTIQKREVCLPTGPLRATGEYEILLQLHSEVSTTIKVQVIPAK